jgi:two-component system response regulator DegU
MRALIVDDSADSREILRDALEALDIRVSECDNGQKAIDEYRNTRPDVVLMDIQMPVLDGISATRTICSADPNAHVIVVTQFDESDYRLAASRAGAEQYFLKHDILKLLAYIQSLVSLN